MWILGLKGLIYTNTFCGLLCVRIKRGLTVFISLQILMSASLQMLVEPILSVITPLDHTDVNV